MSISLGGKQTYLFLRRRFFFFGHNYGAIHFEENVTEQLGYLNELLELLHVLVAQVVHLLVVLQRGQQFVIGEISILFRIIIRAFSSLTLSLRNELSMSTCVATGRIFWNGMGIKRDKSAEIHTFATRSISAGWWCSLARWKTCRTTSMGHSWWASLSM